MTETLISVGLIVVIFTVIVVLDEWSFRRRTKFLIELFRKDDSK